MITFKQSLLTVAALAGGSLVLAQVPLPMPAPRAPAPVPQPAGPPPTPQAAAPIDLTGYWVSVVTEDWRWRMITPPKGDYASVPLSPAGRKEADSWTEDQDGSCKAYGGANLMRMPTRLHISWESVDVLKIESDWGQQVRHLYFAGAKGAPTGPTAQGTSLARWIYPIAINQNPQNPPPRGPRPPGGYLQVETSNLAPGWLRRNGVPYSDKTTMTEYLQTFTEPSTGTLWFDVTTRIVDPVYLNRPFLLSSDFRKEPDGAKWAPHPCKG
jgi:hypothetical protein